MYCTFQEPECNLTDLVMKVYMVVHLIASGLPEIIQFAVLVRFHYQVWILLSKEKKKDMKNL